jgi:hypothetical protein
MEFENKKLRDVADIAARIMMGEKALHPNQQKLDVHEPEKDELTAKDFEKLRAGKKAEVKKEEVSKPDFIDLDKDGNKKEPMKKAASDKKMKEDVEQIDEVEIVKTATGMKVYGSSYGDSAKARRDQVKRPVDDVKGPNKSELNQMISKKKKMSEMVATYKEQGLKGLFEALKKDEVIVEEPTSAEFDAQLADAKQRAAGTKKQPEVSKPAVQAVQNEETHTTVEFIDYNDVNGVKISEIDLEERSMTKPEMKKKEEIVKSMKKGISGFKDRYGDRAKEVMYATATKNAMKD